MLIFDQVSKSYKQNGVHTVILKNQSFVFPADKHIGIMGRNGAGKSTMMRLISGVELPDHGKIYRNQKVSWRLGFTGGFNGSMTGIENIRFVARIYDQDAKYIIDYVEDFSELGDDLKKPIKTYSNGMKARLAFGLSMAINFDIYLIDEVTAVGDKNFKAKCQTVFKSKLAHSQIIMVSHGAKTIREYCNCGLILENGELTYYPTVDALIKAYKRSK